MYPPSPPPAGGADRNTHTKNTFSGDNSEHQTMQVVNMEDTPFVVVMFLFGVATYFLHEGWSFC